LPSRLERVSQLLFDSPLDLKSMAFAKLSEYRSGGVVTYAASPSLLRMVIQHHSAPIVCLLKFRGTSPESLSALSAAAGVLTTVRERNRGAALFVVCDDQVVEDSGVCRAEACGDLVLFNRGVMVCSDFAAVQEFLIPPHHVRVSVGTVITIAGVDHHGLESVELVCSPCCKCARDDLPAQHSRSSHPVESHGTVGEPVTCSCRALLSWEWPATLEWGAARSSSSAGSGVPDRYAWEVIATTVEENHAGGVDVVEVARQVHPIGSAALHWAKLGTAQLAFPEPDEHLDCRGLYECSIRTVHVPSGFCSTWVRLTLARRTPGGCLVGAELATDTHEGNAR
jgi:hypothetical protein